MSNFRSADLVVPSANGSSTPVFVKRRSTLMIGLSGTLNATVQFEYSPDETGDVWVSIDSALTAAGLVFLRAGQARRVRATVSSYVSGDPVGTMFHDLALDAVLIERTFKEVAILIPSSATEGAAVDTADGEQLLFSASGTFVATLQLQISLSEAGDDWHNWGPALTAAGVVRVPRGVAARVRVDTVAHTSGAPVGTLLKGFAAEVVAGQSALQLFQEKSGQLMDEVGQPELVTSGALSLLVEKSLISVTGTAAYTLADGLYIGQPKKFICTVAASTPDGTLTPATFADGTNIDIDALLEAGELVWTATGWRVMMLVGAAVA